MAHINKLFALIAIGLCVNVANADPTPPGSAIFIADGQGWSGWLNRVGTTGTIWDTPTVAFTGLLSFANTKNTNTEIEFYKSRKNKLFFIRVDKDEVNGDAVRRCVYTGSTNRAPGYFLNEKDSEFFDNVKEIAKNEASPNLNYGKIHEIGGTFFCSGMKFEGVWFGVIRP